MDTIERAARAYAEWELGLEGEAAKDDIRFGKDSAESKRAEVERLWPSKIVQTRQLLEAGETGDAPRIEGGSRGDLLNHIRDKVFPSRRALNDDALLAAYQATDGEPSNLEAAALLAEIRRRNLDI
ncbi:hypothetical protein [Sphingomonas melonis]|uniref:Uncharacterized protein n=1 Tax=Sphingomonas melonis TaxID=152682 RepID=A0A7Y9FJZ7_9SPHN|nr:hypothetical protein [Sphingomonas melonis]NYD88734.1 hypothetical protein [Sphingomonas melonis]